ncbi:xylanase [Lentisphaera araneosa HTCC2155]|uniref:Xylanase n=1 Tax=Lentisphaera araneosa HTCC2155 TaxID=313628 RepID=A6DGK4_9BACT|nr:alpha/beta hydrolase [Lentisphaera araneosa]EDM29321.1 xylanase [Lentisphaera araneosa HTCC2155]
MTSPTRKHLNHFFLAIMFTLCLSSQALDKQELRLWPQLAPGESDDKKAPRLYFFQAKKQLSDSLVLIFPGGGYHGLAIDHEGWQVAKYFNDKGINAVVLKYRVPRPKGQAKHMTAWQDAQRAVRVVRSNASKWKINPEKIAALGFSAGGHLTLMTATSSQTPAYQAIDELDKLPCHINYAVPVYPAYVLEDGSNGPNKGKGNNSTLVKDFKFDAKTPPMCLIHGDTDQYSPMNSVAIYHKLRTMNIPAELHIFAKVGHGFGARPCHKKNKHVGDWLNRSYEALKVFGF